MAKDKKDQRDEEMPVEGSSVFVPYEDGGRDRVETVGPRGEERVPGTLELGESRVGLTYAEERRLDNPVPLAPVGERHQLSTDVGPEPAGDEEPSDAMKLAQAGREHRQRLGRAVSVHHQLGELARAQGAYPGEILGLHTSRGQEAMLGMGNPGAREAIEAGAVDFEANVIRAAPQGMASRYDPNEE